MLYRNLSRTSDPLCSAKHEGRDVHRRVSFAFWSGASHTQVKVLRWRYVAVLSLSLAENMVSWAEFLCNLLAWRTVPFSRGNYPFVWYVNWLLQLFLGCSLIIHQASFCLLFKLIFSTVLEALVWDCPSWWVLNLEGHSHQTHPNLASRPPLLYSGYTVTHYRCKDKASTLLSLICLQVVKYRGRRNTSVCWRWLLKAAGGYLQSFADNDPCLKEFPVRFMKPFQFIVFPSKVSK